MNICKIRVLWLAMSFFGSGALFHAQWVDVNYLNFYGSNGMAYVAFDPESQIGANDAYLGIVNGVGSIEINTPQLQINAAAYFGGSVSFSNAPTIGGSSLVSQVSLNATLANYIQRNSLGHARADGVEASIAVFLPVQA